MDGAPEDKEIERLLENAIEIGPHAESPAHDVDIAAEEEKSIDFSD